jgi:hypothetical protein
LAMLVPHLDEYATKYQHIKFDRQDGILQVTLHTEHKDSVWGFLPHQELGYCFGDIGSDPENKVIILRARAKPSFTRKILVAVRSMPKLGPSTSCPTPNVR